MSDFSTMVGKTFPWHELYVPNGEAAKEFYSKLFGWGTQPMDMGEMGTYEMFTQGDAPFCGMMATANQPEMQNVPPHWSIYISVDDVDAKVAAATGMGANVLVPAMDVPEVGRMALLQDPQGATFWVYRSAQAG